ncbi:MAG: hypothetical protein ACTSW1_11155 [Candidatus Hodarchaeales archaeon]
MKWKSRIEDIRKKHGNPNNELMVFDWDDTLDNGVGTVKTDIIEAASEKYALSIASWSNKSYVLRVLHELGLFDRFDTIKVQFYGKDQMMAEILSEYIEIYGTKPNRVIFVDDMTMALNEVQSMFPEIICIHPDKVWEYL